MSFQTRYFYANIIGLPVVNPNPILCFELSSLWCKKIKCWMDHPEGNVSVPSQLWVQFQINNNSDKWTEKQKNIIAWSY